MDEIEFEWDGKSVRRRIDVLVDRSNQPPPGAAAAATAGRTEVPGAATPAPAATVAKSAIGPGADTGRGFKICNPNDNMPPGSVVDGYRKTIYPTPFGDACRWDEIGGRLSK